MKKETYNKPINISEDIWFYVNPKSFHFVVWARIGNQKQCVQFRLLHRKIKKFLIPNKN